MNQALKIINTVGLMNQTATEEMGTGPISREVYARKEKMSLRGTKLHLSLRGTWKIPSHVIARSKATKQSQKKGREKMGPGPIMYR